MNIISSPDFRAQLLKKIAEREFSERTGCHNSDLVYCLNRQGLRRLQPSEPTDDELLLFSLGWSTQRWLTGQDEDEPEKEVDGIIVTLDARYTTSELVDKEAFGRTIKVFKCVPWELKATYQGSARPIEENLAWIRQIMSQCYVTGTTEAYLSRLEIMGDWKMRDPNFRRPTLSAWKLTFTKDELERHWDWMKDRRDKFLKILETGELLPKIQSLPSGMEFLCEKCSFKGKECQE